MKMPTMTRNMKKTPQNGICVLSETVSSIFSPACSALMKRPGVVTTGAAGVVDVSRVDEMVSIVEPMLLFVTSSPASGTGCADTPSAADSMLRLLISRLKRRALEKCG